MKIRRLHHAQIVAPPGWEDAVRRFYCELLGLQEVEKPAALEGRGGLWLQIGDQQVHVGVEQAPAGLTTRAHLAYVVDDLAAWRTRLEAAGLEIGDAIPIPGLQRFEFRDPFGNRMEFVQPETAGAGPE